MRITAATPQDTELVVAFYNFMIEATDGQPSSPRWEKDVHPTRDELRESIGNGQLLIAVQGDSSPTADGGENPIMAAMRLAREPYDTPYATWKNNVPEDQVCTITLLAVHPSHQRKGIGRKLVRVAQMQAMEWGCKSIRLDTIDGNVDAARLYRSLGFTQCGRGPLHPATIGDTPFDIFEYAFPIITLDD